MVAAGGNIQVAAGGIDIFPVAQIRLHLRRLSGIGGVYCGYIDKGRIDVIGEVAELIVAEADRLGAGGRITIIGQYDVGVIGIKYVFIGDQV